MGQKGKYFRVLCLFNRTHSAQAYKPASRYNNNDSWRGVMTMMRMKIGAVASGIFCLAIIQAGPSWGARIILAGYSAEADSNQARAKFGEGSERDEAARTPDTNTDSYDHAERQLASRLKKGSERLKSESFVDRPIVPEPEYLKVNEADLGFVGGVKNITGRAFLFTVGILETGVGVGVAVAGTLLTFGVGGWIAIPVGASLAHDGYGRAKEAVTGHQRDD